MQNPIGKLIDLHKLVLSKSTSHPIKFKLLECIMSLCKGDLTDSTRYLPYRVCFSLVAPQNSDGGDQ